jgi:hypothetical protein
MIPSAGKRDTITWSYNSNNQPIKNDECPTKYKGD